MAIAPAGSPVSLLAGAWRGCHCPGHTRRSGRASPSTDRPASVSGAPAGSPHTRGLPGPGPPAACAPARQLAWRLRRDSAGAPPSPACGARRLSARHLLHRGVGVPSRCTPSSLLCYDRGRYAAPWLLAVSGPRGARRRQTFRLTLAPPRGGRGRRGTPLRRPAGLAGHPGEPRPWGVLTDRGGEARPPED